MRILFLSHYFPPEVNAPASRTYEHCVRWVQAGHEVTVVTCAPNCPDGIVYPGYENRMWRQMEWVDGIRVVRVWTFLAANSGTVRRIINYLSFMVSVTLAAMRLRRPDVVVATSPQFFCGWAGVLVSRLKGVPLVLEIRDVWPESIQATEGLQQGTFVLGWVQRLAEWMYRAADHIVAVGNGYRDKILEVAGEVADRISVITNGVDLKFFVPREADAALRREWGLDGRFVCSYLGTIGMAHRLEVVLEAAKLLKQKGRSDICFVLVGDGARRAQLQREAKEAALEDLVVFVGRQPKDRMPAILASSDACVIHLRKCQLFTTVIPSKIFETMAMGRPIIMGVEGEAREIVMAAQAGLVMEPESPESLVQAVETLADDSGLTSRLARAARDYVARYYNRDVLAGRYLQLLRHVAGKSGTVQCQQVLPGTAGPNRDAGPACGARAPATAQTGDG